MWNSICDATCFGSTLKEKYEAIYVKLVEMSNILLAECEHKKIKVGQICIYAGVDIASIFESLTTPCYFHVPLDKLNEYCEKLKQDRSKSDKAYIGSFRGGEWKVYQDNKLSPNQVIIECESSKAELTVENLCY
jgi:hypothetical protein